MNLSDSEQRFQLVGSILYAFKFVLFTQDIILNSVMAGLTVLTTIGVIIIAVVLFVVLIAVGGIVVAIFALPIVST